MRNGDEHSTVETSVREPYQRVTRALAQEFDRDLPLDVIERCVAEEASHFVDARVTTYVEILVQKAARDRLAMLRHNGDGGDVREPAGSG